jgi:serine protease Do
MKYPIQLAMAFAFASVCSTTFAQEDAEEQLQKAVQEAVSAVAPSVVRIETFGGLEKVGAVRIGDGPTTGVVVSPEGHVLSSAFNFVQKPSGILITMPDGKRTGAQIVARDHARMLVLLEPDERKSGMPVPRTVSRDQLRQGQWAIAVGRTFGGEEPNISTGIISATNRIWGKAIQTDAKISPSNYGGPLIDLRGRIAGILVPLSPQGQGEIAGAEWYDSGIGFAVPLNEVMPHIEKMQSGEDLHPGLLGVSLKQGNTFADPAVVAACQPNSPGAKAGLKKDDEIVEIDGKTINRQSELRHALGSKYAGETVHVVAMRGGQKIEADITLVDKLTPFEHPFLGVLPKRATGRKGVTVRHIYPDSPAHEAGIQVGDRITHLAGREVADAASLQEMISTLDEPEAISLTLDRAGKAINVSAKLASQPAAIPAELPAARESRDEFKGDRPAIGEVEVKIPAETNTCFAYVPASYDPEVPYGLLLTLHAPGRFNKNATMKRWIKLCDENDLILLAPKATDDKKWNRTEIDYVQKAIDNISDSYHVDPTRVVIHGAQGGGAMAYLVAFNHPELINGVAVVDATLPRGARPPANDPVRRLAFYTTISGDSTQRARIEAGVKQLRAMKYPVTVKPLEEANSKTLDDAARAELARWIDTLDRI